MNNYEIKNGVFCFCCLLTIIMTILGIVALIEYNKMSSENDYLKNRIKEQSMLIEYLKEKE